MSAGWLHTCGITTESRDAGTSEPASAITDFTTTTDQITLAGCADISNVTVDMDLSHTYQADLLIDLTSPTGTVVRLWNGSMHHTATNDIIGSFNETFRLGVCPPAWNLGSGNLGAGFRPYTAQCVDEAYSADDWGVGRDLDSYELLSTFDGENSTGDWTLDVYDQAGGDSGTLNAWGVNVTCPESGVGGSMECWGSDDEGQSTPPAGTFDSVSTGGGGASSGSDGYTCGITTWGGVQCWGEDGFGQSTNTP